MSGPNGDNRATSPDNIARDIQGLGSMEKQLIIPDKELIEMREHLVRPILILYRSPAPEVQSSIQMSADFLRGYGFDIRVVFYDDEPSAEQLAVHSDLLGKPFGLILNEELFERATEIKNTVWNVEQQIWQEPVEGLRSMTREEEKRHSALRKEMACDACLNNTNDEVDRFLILARKSNATFKHLTEVNVFSQGIGNKAKNRGPEQVMSKLAEIISEIYQNVSKGGIKLEVKLVVKCLFDHELDYLFDDKPAYQELRKAYHKAIRENPDSDNDPAIIAFRELMDSAAQRIKSDVEIALQARGINVEIDVLNDLDSLTKDIAKQGPHAEGLTLYIGDRHVLKYHIGGVWECDSASGIFLRLCADGREAAYNGGLYNTKQDPAGDDSIDMTGDNIITAFLKGTPERARTISQKISASSGMLVLPLFDMEGATTYSGQLGALARFSSLTNESLRSPYQSFPLLVACLELSVPSDGRFTENALKWVSGMQT